MRVHAQDISFYKYKTHYYFHLVHNCATSQMSLLLMLNYISVEWYSTDPLFQIKDFLMLFST